MRLDLSQVMVMVVDDNRFIRRIVHEILKSFNVGYILEAENGVDALEKLKLAKPDVIFCDWRMEPMSGMDLLREIRAGKTPVDAKTPVIMLTGQLDASHVIEARNVGVSGYLAKPVSPEGVMSRLVDVIRATAPAGHA